MLAETWFAPALLYLSKRLLAMWFKYPGTPRSSPPSPLWSFSTTFLLSLNTSSLVDSVEFILKSWKTISHCTSFFLSHFWYSWQFNISCTVGISFAEIWELVLLLFLYRALKNLLKMLDLPLWLEVWPLWVLLLLVVRPPFDLMSVLAI